MISIFSVTLVTMYGQTRILFAMGRDGMLPKIFAKVSARTQTPVNNTIIVAIVVSLLAAFVPLDYLIDVVSIGTLTAFIVVSLGVIILRYRQPDLPRGFKVPFFPVTPDPVDPRLRLHPGQPALVHLAGLRLWVGVFIVFYLLYGRKHSVLGRMLAGEDVDADDAEGAHDRSGRLRAAQGRARLAGSRDAARPRAGDLPRRWSPSSRGSGRRPRWPGSTPSTPSSPSSWASRPRPRRGSTCVDPSVDVPIDYHAVTGRSVTSALLQAAEECRRLGAGARLAAPTGRWVAIVVGSTTDKLLHSSPIPLALSPRGYRSTAADGFSRVTCAFSDGEESEKVVAQAVSFARSLGTPARVASFGVRGATMYPPEVGLSAEDSVLDSWREQASHAQSQLRIDEVIDEDTETVIATGAGWGESMSSVDWEPNELLVLGSSTLGPIARVFLGSRATKLIRHSPVPVLVVPRGYELDAI